MRAIINSRADLERLRGTPEFAHAMKQLHGSMTSWSMGGGEWVAEEDLSTIKAFGFTKSEFLAEAKPFNFAPPSAPTPRPGPTNADVIAERERRLGLGFEHDFGDERGVHSFGTTREDMQGWDEVDKLALSLRASDQGATPISVLTNTGPVQVTADEWPAVMLAAAAFRQPIWQASFVLQAMDPTPADYATNESYWP